MFFALFGFCAGVTTLVVSATSVVFYKRAIGNGGQKTVEVPLATRQGRAVKTITRVVRLTVSEEIGSTAGHIVTGLAATPVAGAKLAYRCGKSCTLYAVKQAGCGLCYCGRKVIGLVRRQPGELAKCDAEAEGNLAADIVVGTIQNFKQMLDNAQQPPLKLEGN